MEKHSTCPFCGNNRKSFLVDNGYDVSAMYFYEDEDFSISPDLSPLVTGHLLVIPTKHYASFGEIEDISMLSRIRSVAEQLLGTKDLLIFEHGAVIEGEGGASVDHAHMHIMPRPTNMTVTLIVNMFVNLDVFHQQKLWLLTRFCIHFFLKDNHTFSMKSRTNDLPIRRILFLTSFCA